MAELDTGKLKAVSKRDFEKLIDPKLHQALEVESIHHSGVLTIAISLTNFLGTQLRHENTTLVEWILTQALTELTVASKKGSVKDGFQAYSYKVFELLHFTFKYSVFGKTSTKPSLDSFWDCTKESFNGWFSRNAIRPATMDIRYHGHIGGLTPESAGYILSHHVFTRAQLELFGLVTEIEGAKQ